MSIKNSNIRENIGNNIRLERLKRNLSVDFLAEYLDVSSSFIGLVERGKRGMSIDLLIKLTGMFEVTLDNLILPAKKSNKKNTNPKNTELEFFINILKEDEINLLFKFAELLALRE